MQNNEMSGRRAQRRPLRNREEPYHYSSARGRKCCSCILKTLWTQLLHTECWFVRLLLRKSFNLFTVDMKGQLGLCRHLYVEYLSWCLFRSSSSLMWTLGPIKGRSVRALQYFIYFNNCSNLYSCWVRHLTCVWHTHCTSPAASWTWRCEFWCVCQRHQGPMWWKNPSSLIIRGRWIRPWTSCANGRPSGSHRSHITAHSV